MQIHKHASMRTVDETVCGLALALLFLYLPLPGWCQEDPHPSRAGQTVAPAVSLGVGPNQKGLIGDEVPRAEGVPNHGWRHFVTPKGGADDALVLVASLTPPPGVTAPAAFESTYQWVGGTPIEGDPLSRKVTRAAAAMTEVKIVHKNAPEKVADKIRVWVIWGALDTVPDGSFPLDYRVTTGEVTINGGYQFKCVLAPAAMFNGAADVPKMLAPMGANPPDVPVADDGVFNKGVNLTPGAKNKFDMSRQVRQRILNPSNLPKPQAPDDKFWTSYLNWPSIATCGNDDRSQTTEVNAPTVEDPSLEDNDLVQNFVLHALGAVNDTLEFRLHFVEFARVEIGGQWYVVSNRLNWRVHFKFKKGNAPETNPNGHYYAGDEHVNALDFNNNGTTDDIAVPIWLNDGSTMDKTNDGF